MLYCALICHASQFRMMTAKMARSKILAARSHLCDQSVGFSCAVTVRGAWDVASCILESTTKVSCFFVLCVHSSFLDLERWVPKSYSSCSCCWNQLSESPKIPKAFLIHSGAQQNYAYTFVLTIAQRSTVSDFSVIF